MLFDPAAGAEPHMIGEAMSSLRLLAETHKKLVSDGVHKISDSQKLRCVRVFMSATGETRA